MLPGFNCSRGVLQQKTQHCKWHLIHSQHWQQRQSTPHFRLRYLHDSVTSSLLHAPAADLSRNAGATTEQAAPLPLQQALEEDRLAFGFSAGGLLFPYYLGVGEQLQQQGLLRAGTQLSGASAGSLIAACLKSGLPLSTITDACLELAQNCRTGGTRHRLKKVLEDTLRQLLPEDVAQRCSGGVHVAVTRLVPGVRPQLVSHFRDRDDLISALLTSCHIPWYFDGNLITTFRKEPCFDGGFTNFLPDVPGATTVRVCCLPSRQLGRVGGIAISPDTFNPDWPHSLQTMLGWAFEPAEEEQLLQLIECGKADAAAWAEAAGLSGGLGTAAAVVSNGNGSSGNGSHGDTDVIMRAAAAAASAEQQQAQQQPVGRSLVMSLLGQADQPRK